MDKDMGKYNQGWVIDGLWYHEGCIGDEDVAIYTISEQNHYCHKCHKKMTRMTEIVNKLEGEEREKALKGLRKYHLSTQFPIALAQSKKEEKEYLESLK